MRVFLVYAHVTSLVGRNLQPRILCNRLSRDNTRVLDKLYLAQTPLSITISLMSSEITLPAKDATTPTVENQLCRLRKLTTAKPLMTSQIYKNPSTVTGKRVLSPQYDQQLVPIQHSLTVVNLQTFNHWDRSLSQLRVSKPKPWISLNTSRSSIVTSVHGQT